MQSTLLRLELFNFELFIKTKSLVLRSLIFSAKLLSSRLIIPEQATSVSWLTSISRMLCTTFFHLLMIFTSSGRSFVPVCTINIFVFFTCFWFYIIYKAFSSCTWVGSYLNIHRIRSIMTIYMFYHRVA